MPTARRWKTRRLTYGIVFSNFMSKGVYTFQGGTDRLIGLMERGTAGATASTCASAADVEKIHVAGGRVQGVTVTGRHDQAPGRSSPTPI